MSTNTLILSIVAIVCGATLAYLQPNNPIGAVLVAAGAGALGVSNINARAAAEKEKAKAADERKRADDAFEQTQTLTREMLQRLPPKD